MCRALHAHVRPHLRRHLCLVLNLDLDLNLNLALIRALFQKPFEKLNPALFRRLYGLKYRSLLGLVNLAAYRRT